ncbi:MAG: rod shape-determining protein MreC [Armatimonadota bacterium]
MSVFRHRIAISLTSLLILGILTGVAHKRALDSGRSFVANDAVRLALTPLSIASRRVFALGEWLVRVARPRRSILRENARLRAEVRRLTRENAQLAEAAHENARLRKLLGLKQNVPLDVVAAEIVSRNASSWFETAIIDRGRRSGVEPGDAVVNFRGLVGQVVESNLTSSQVAAITDPASAVGAMVRRSRSTGILQGQGSDYLALNYLPKDADVRKSDIVVTSGMGGVIPKGFVIGRVIRVVRDATPGTTTALVRPSVRLDEVEQVLVVRRGAGG